VSYLSVIIRAFFPSPGVAGAPTCKYHPTCSEYARLALRELGPIRGSVATVWRLLRCNPWSKGGVDYPSGRHA
jgi:putative membrane protein insertion efficiency factor